MDDTRECGGSKHLKCQTDSSEHTPGYGLLIRSLAPLFIFSIHLGEGHEQSGPSHYCLELMQIRPLRTAANT